MTVSVKDFEDALIEAVNAEKLVDRGYGKVSDELFSVEEMIEILEYLGLVFGRKPYRKFKTRVGEVSIIENPQDAEYFDSQRVTALFQIEVDDDTFEYVQYTTHYSSWDGLYWNNVKGVLVKPVPKVTMVWETVED